MAFLQFRGVGITGLAAAVPQNIINNYEYTAHFPKEEVKEVVDKLGIYERRFVDDHTCASDLCLAAANRLFDDLEVERSEVDLLIFVSQTPDYRMPATSILLQNRLGLPKSTMAFDVSLGCSGFVYGLSIAYAFMERGGLRKALLLDGETRSKVYSAKDRRTGFLFGDGGVAVLIERHADFGESFFSMNSDGSRESLIKINAGGYRNPSSAETVKEKVVDEHGNIRSEEHGYMNGGDVFNFAIQEVPKDIKGLLEFSGCSQSEVDYFVFHQANNFMNSYLVRKMKLDPKKVPSSISKFGNTSSVSIPLTIASELMSTIRDKKLLLSGFGVGMSWASAIINTAHCKVSKLVEV